MPPPAAHVSLQLWPSAPYCQMTPLFPQEASARGAKGGTDGGGGSGGRGGGSGGEDGGGDGVMSHGQTRWSWESELEHEKFDEEDG